MKRTRQLSYKVVLSDEETSEGRPGGKTGDPAERGRVTVKGTQEEERTVEEGEARPKGQRSGGREGPLRI